MTFINEQFLTAKEKEKILRDWERLLKAMAFDAWGTRVETETGTRCSKFTKALYNHLHLHCGFIAHYNQAGFFDAQFGTPDRIIQFLDSFIQGTGYGRDYQDLNTAMRKVLYKYGADIKDRCNGTIKSNEITLGKALLAKHGIKV